MPISSPLPQRLRITHSSSITHCRQYIDCSAVHSPVHLLVHSVARGVDVAAVASTQVSGALHNHLVLRLNALVQACRKFASASKLSCRLHDTIAIACLRQRSNVSCSTGMTLSTNLRPRHTGCRSIDSFKCILATTVTDLPNPKSGRSNLPPEDSDSSAAGRLAPGRRRCMEAKLHSD